MKKFFTFIGRSFYWSWKILTNGCLMLTNILFLVSILVILSVFHQSEIQVPANSALIISIKGDIVEKPTAINPVSRIVNGFAGVPLPEETLLQDVLDVIDAASKDDRIQVVVLSLAKMTHSSLDQLQAIGEALDSVKLADKKIIAVDDYYNQGQYYLASYADEIYLNPMGGVELRGFGIYRLYMKELIDKLAINFHIFRVGSFKSATEPFLRNNMSEDAKTANRLWLTTLWDRYCNEVADNRGLTPGTINKYINNMPELLRQADRSTSRMALEAKLVDGLKTRYEIEEYLRSIVGTSADKKTFNNIEYRDYLTKITPSYTKQNSQKDQIGLIIAQGNIMYGKQMPGQIGSDDLRKLIRSARKNNKIKALVLRIDSGGGSAFASEQIRRELMLFQQEGKPLVISMGALAASGAYWISAPADHIVASPTTLTGSIGIFGILPTFENSFAKIGIHSDGIATTKMAGGGNPAVSLSPEQKETIQLAIEEGYDHFVNIVAEGRGIPRAEVEKIAQGRVWDGVTAQRLGLVDSLGNMSDAIAEAAALAVLDDYTPTYIQTQESPSDKLLSELGLETASFLEQYKLVNSAYMPVLQALNNEMDFTLFNNDPTRIYSHCLLPETVTSF